MTDHKPTGVFVRLPLSEEQAHVFLKESSAAWDEYNGSSDGLACASGLLAIGTFVTGGELEVAGWCQPQQLDDLHTDNDSPENERFVVMSRVQIGSRDILLVRQSDAQAAIAALQAENVRLREIITTARVSIANGNPMKAAYALEGALEGGTA